MKKLLLSVCILALLCSCAPKPPVNDDVPGPGGTPGQTPDQTPGLSSVSMLDKMLPVDAIAQMILGACRDDVSGVESLKETQDEETVAFYLTELYGLEDGSWSDCAVYRAGGARAFEIAVIRLKDPETAWKVQILLDGYIDRREGDFTGYEPEEAELVSRALATVSDKGDVALLICRDAAVIKNAFLDSYAILDRIPFDPPYIDDMTCYDTTAILDAWRSGDTSALSEKDAAILNLASAVLAKVIVPGMSDYEREKAVYTWITANVDYDQDHYDVLVKLDPDSSNPYGPLHNGKGICLGFATAFQLLMDMTEVECITITGSSFSNGEDHAWNMVRLNGRWYCADATWDKGRSEANWAYFNCTSRWMADTDHQWDYANTPEATAIDMGTYGNS